MKAPINFVERLTGYVIHTYWLSYNLQTIYGKDNILWIYPQWNSTNSIRLDFDWSKHTYSVCVAKNGDGANFHTTHTMQFNPNDFKSFDLFIKWLCEQIKDWTEIFD
jgi:hypothetical protein